jgi:hypothetical protein
MIYGTAGSNPVSINGWTSSVQCAASRIGSKVSPLMFVAVFHGFFGPNS